MPKYFLGKRIIVFTAHPDDEQLAAGTMYANYRAGGITYLVIATSGEKGKSHLIHQLSDAQLMKVREKELRAAAKILHIKKIFFLHVPDGKVRENKRTFYTHGLKIARAFKPEQILSFGPDGISGHLDHIVAGKVAFMVAKQLEVPMAAFTLCDELIGDRVQRRNFFLGRRKFGIYADVPKHRRPHMSIKVDGKVKRKAMAMHRSQFGTSGVTPFEMLPRPLAQKMFGYEHFVKEKM